MKLTADEWACVTRVLHDKVAQYFEPKENLMILDFIQTAKQDTEAAVSEIEARESKARESKARESENES